MPFFQTGNLDSSNGEAMMQLLSDLHRLGPTVCMVTHDPRYAAFAERQIFVFDGSVVADAAGAGLENWHLVRPVAV